MPELANRAQYERRFLSALAGASALAQSIIVGELGYPPSAAQITPDLLERVHRAFGEVMANEIERVFIEAGQGMGVLNLPYDMDEAQQAAAVWGAPYAAARVQQMQATTQRRLLALISAVGTAGAIALSEDAFRARLQRIFNRSRMENIAVTETTFAHQAGERAIVEQWRGAGLPGRLVAYHQTAEDDRVCPICAPRNDKQITDDKFAPLHFGCRCFTRWIYEE